MEQQSQHVGTIIHLADVIAAAWIVGAVALEHTPAEAELLQPGLAQRAKRPSKKPAAAATARDSQGFAIT